MTPTAIRTDTLSKHFGPTAALCEVSVNVPTGCLAALVGPQGAGKSTLLNILAGLARSSGGRSWIFDLEVCPGRKHSLGAFVDAPAFYPSLSGRRNLELLATLAEFPVNTVESCIDLLDLAAVADDAYRTYTMGYRQRLAIAAAFVGSPALVLLDEPTNGLDPAATQRLYAVLRSLVAGGTTVVMTTHLLQDVEHHCDWTIVLDKGRLAWQGPTPTWRDLLDLMNGAPR